MTTLKTDSDQNTGFDYIADLLSGRIHNMLNTINNSLRGLETRLNIEEQNTIMATVNEQAILDAAQTIRDFQATMADAVSAINSKIVTLMSQAQSTTPVANPEDVSDEIQVLNQAIAGLGSITTALQSAATPDTSGQAPTPGEQAPPTPPQPEIPLAGESGGTNGDPTAEQPQPGSSLIPNEETPVDEDVDEGTIGRQELEGEFIDEDDDDFDDDPFEDDDESDVVVPVVEEAETSTPTGDGSTTEESAGDSETVV